MILKNVFSSPPVAGALLLSACGGVMTASSDARHHREFKDVAYVAATTYVHAIRLSDGSEVWRYPEKAEPNRMFYAAPVLVGDQLIVGDYRNELHSIIPITGNSIGVLPERRGSGLPVPWHLIPCFWHRADHFLCVGSKRQPAMEI